MSTSTLYAVMRRSLDVVFTPSLVHGRTLELETDGETIRFNFTPTGDLVSVHVEREPFVCGCPTAEDVRFAEERSGRALEELRQVEEERDEAREERDRLEQQLAEALVEVADREAHIMALLRGGVFIPSPGGAT